MTYYSLSALINVLVSFLLGAFVIYKNYRSRLNRSLFFWCLTVASWSFFYFVWQLETRANWALLWTRLLMVGAVWVPIAYFRVVVLFLGIEEKYRRFIYFNFALAVIFTGLLATPLMVSHVEPVAGFMFWPRPGFVYALFLVMFLGLSGYAAYLSVRAMYSAATLPIKRAQIKYMLLGIAISIAGGSTNYFLWYDIPIKPYGNILASTYVVFTVYAILRYRLMDIRIASRKVLIYLLSSAFIYAIFYFVIWVYEYYFGGIHTLRAYAAGVVIAPAFLLALYSFNRLVTWFANRYFFYSLYNYQETINKLADELNSYIDLDKIVSLIVDTIKETMQLNRAGVLLIDAKGGVLDYKIAKVIGFNRKNGVSLVQDNFLTQHLQKAHVPLVLEELLFLARDAKSREEKRGFTDLYEHMNRIEASLCLPLMSSNKLIGIIVLGAKVSGDAYTKEDLELLNTLSKQAGIAIENARLYRQVQEFGQKLTAEVDKATHDLKEANAHLEALIKIKDEFLQIASHQLRTPVSVMRGMLDMLREEGSSLTQEQRDEMIERASLKSEKLSQVIDDVLSATEMDVPNFNISGTAREVDLRELARKAFESQKDEAVDKGLTLTLEANDTVPPVKASDTYLPQAMTNLIDNAIKYTKDGSVTVKVYQEEKMVVFAVQDTGIGVPEEDLQKLWTKFKRGGNAKNMHTDGSGLGLFIIKKIVEGHPGGKVFVESKLGSGSTFGFKLPMIKEQ